MREQRPDSRPVMASAYEGNAHYLTMNMSSSRGNGELSIGSQETTPADIYASPTSDLGMRSACCEVVPALVRPTWLEEIIQEGFVKGIVIYGGLHPFVSSSFVFQEGISTDTTVC